MNQPATLTLEQQFALRSFETQVENLSAEQARHLLVKLYEQRIVMEATYKALLKAEWGIESTLADAG